VELHKFAKLSPKEIQNSEIIYFAPPLVFLTAKTITRRYAYNMPSFRYTQSKHKMATTYSWRDSEMRILLVDDDLVFAQVVVTKIAALGLRDVTVAHSAEQALALLDHGASPFDCFLLDIFLGDSCGIDLCRTMRLHADNKLVPIIMVTSQRGNALMSRAFSAGATDFLRKPLDHNELVGRIKTAMLLVELTKKNKARIEAPEILRQRNDLSVNNESLKAFWFPNVKGMVEFARFQEKLSELRSRNETPKLYRAHIRNFGSLVRQLDLTEFKRHLHTLSRVLSEAGNGEQFLFCYLGRGRFIICLQIDTKLNVGQTAMSLQDRVNVRLDQSRSAKPNTSQLQISDITARFAIGSNSTSSDLRDKHPLTEDPHALDLPRVDEIEQKMFQKALAEEKKQDV